MAIAVRLAMIVVIAVRLTTVTSIVDFFLNSISEASEDGDRRER